MPAPDPVGHDPRGERVAGITEPPGQFETPAGGLDLGLVEACEEGREPLPGLLTEGEVVASEMNLEVFRLPLLDAHDLQLGSHFLFQFCLGFFNRGDRLPGLGGKERLVFIAREGEVESFSDQGGGPGKQLFSRSRADPVGGKARHDGLIEFLQECGVSGADGRPGSQQLRAKSKRPRDLGSVSMVFARGFPRLD